MKNLIKKKYRFLSSLLLLLFIVPQLFAGKLSFNSITIEDGLSQNTVYCILQDSKGFLWFGTQDGLNQYDAYNFKIFTNDLENPAGISGRQILNLHEDKFQNIWIGTQEGGLSIYDPKQNKFTIFKHSPENAESLPHNHVTAIAENSGDPAGNVWIGTFGGLTRISTKDGKNFTLQNINLNKLIGRELLDERVSALRFDSAGNLWIGTWGSELYKYYLKQQIIEKIEFPGKLNSNRITEIFEDDTHSLWIGTNNDGIFKYDLANHSFTNYAKNPADPASGVSENHILSISSYEFENKKYLMIGTEGGGLNMFDPVSKKFIHYIHAPDDEKSITHNDVHSILAERSGQLWIGTNGGGLNIYDKHANKFNHYKHEPGNPNSLSHEYVWAIFESRDGILWLGTDLGLNEFDRKNDKIRHWQHDPSDPASLSNNEVMAVYEDRQGYLWVGTWRGGIDRFNRKTGKFEHFRHDPANPNSISENQVRLIYEDPISDGKILWIGTNHGGLNRFNLETEKFEHFKHDPGDDNSLGNNSVLSVFRDRQNVLWVGTWGGGLNRFDEQTGTFKRYVHDPENPGSIKSNAASIIYEDLRGNLWVGTHGGGLNLYLRETDSFINFRVKDGLPNDVIYGILEDEQGFLWISTNRGLSRFNPFIRKFMNYEAKDGLQSNEFNNMAFYKSSSNELFFGGINGFNSFFAKNIRNNPYQPPVVFTDFKIFNKRPEISEKSPLKQTIAFMNNLDIDYSSSMFTIEFSALNYSLPEKNLFRYKLEGFDPDWNYTRADRRFATYTNMEPGEYTFRVEAANNDGIWNPRGRELNIVIHPPIWMTWWFRSLVFLAVAGFLWRLYSRRMAKIEKQKQKLEEQVAKRTAELQSQKNQLEEALSHVKQLSGLLPICSSCKKIRDDSGYWNKLETYIETHSEADFSHGICPDCYKTLYPDLYELKNNKKK